MRLRNLTLISKLKLAVGLGLVWFLLWGVPAVKAQELVPEATESVLEASQEAVVETTGSTLVDPEIKQTIQEKKEQDLTETGSRNTDNLALLVENQDLKGLSFFNFVRYAIRGAIAKGLPANIIVILLMFPALASLIALSRHIIGLRGFGIYAPAVLSVAFVSTGIPQGICMFILVIVAAIILKKILGRIKLFPLPRNALLLWGIAGAVLTFLILAANFGWQFFMQISIFPLLIIILLSENFLETQFFSNQQEALKLTIETILIATVGALFMRWGFLQQLVILNPEISLLLICVADFLIGKYSGLRLLEYFRFNSIVKNDS